MPSNTWKRWQAYTGLFQPVGYAIWCSLGSLFQAPSKDVFARGFATWYTKLGHHFARFEEEMTPVPRLVGVAAGVVLEVGPATGNQLSRLDASLITRVYGLEPNAHFLETLKERLKQYPCLSEVYLPLNAALEDESELAQYGIVCNSIDSVICTQVLCSVEDCEEAARTIYRLLKPGGQLLFWEHCASADSFTKLVQRVWSLLWSPLVGHCNLAIDIESALLGAGSWDVKELGHDEMEPYNLMPRVWGCLVKKVE